MDSAVNLSFRYLESDYVRAARAHYASRLRLRFDIIVTIVVALVGAYLWRSPDSHWLGVAAVSVSAGALVDANSYVLYYGSRSFTVIPKRVFQSAEQQGAFDRLLAENVAQIVRTDG